MLFNDSDENVIDADVLKRLIKFANQSHGDLSHAADDIESLKKLAEHNKLQMETLQNDIKWLKIAIGSAFLVMIPTICTLIWLSH
jgi:Cdc6-like AAA superfamily ATPase